MIERNYAFYIADALGEIARRAIVPLASAPVAALKAVGYATTVRAIADALNARGISMLRAGRQRAFGTLWRGPPASRDATSRVGRPSQSCRTIELCRSA
jgi:hypothetical protein